MKDVVTVEAVRSPIGRHNGSLSSVRPDDLLAEVLTALAQPARSPPETAGSALGGPSSASAPRPTAR